MGIGVAIISFGKVAVEGGDDGVGSIVRDIVTFPLPNTGATSIGNDRSTGLVEFLQDTIPLSGVTNLFRSGVDEELCLHRHPPLPGMLHDGDGTCKILIR